MKTEDLISKLAADQTRQPLAPAVTLVIAAAAGALVAGLLLVLTIGIRPDFVQALASWRFDLKFVATLTAAASAYGLVRRAPYPQSSAGLPLWVLLAAPAVLLAGAVAELAAIPAAGWAMAATGKNSMVCLTVIPLLGIVPLGLILWALRQGAPTRPAIAGMCAGVLAGGIAATFYAANCTDDSPLFVLTWYPMAVLVLAVAGAALGRVALRW
jgi:hypothetical protein